MRLAVAIGVIAVTLAAGVYIHQRRVTSYAYSCVDFEDVVVAASTKAACIAGGSSWERTELSTSDKPSWEDPVAVLLAIGGIAIAVGIATAGRNLRRTAS